MVDVGEWVYKRAVESEYKYITSTDFILTRQVTNGLGSAAIDCFSRECIKWWKKGQYPQAQRSK